MVVLAHRHFCLRCTVCHLFSANHFRKFRRRPPDEQFGSNSFIDYSIGIYPVVLRDAVKTEINRETLSFRFVPFVKRTIPWKDIESYKVINYGFVGGYGIRLTMKYGTVYNIKGNKGLFVKLKNGKTFIVGTQKPEELEKVIQELKK